MKRNMLILAAVAVVSMVAGGARADSTFMDINFDGDTAGSAPAVTYPTAPAPVIKPYAIGGYDPTTGNYENPPASQDGTIVVNDAGTMSKAAVLTTNSDEDQTGALWLDTQYLQTATSMKLSFDIDIVNSAPEIDAQPGLFDPNGSSFQFYLNGDTSQLVGLVFAVNQFTNDGTIFDFAAAPTGANGGDFGFRNPNQTDFDSIFSYTNGTTYHVEIDADYATQTVSAYIDGNLEVTGYGMRGGKTSNLLTETFFYVDGEPGTTNSVALDNIVGSAAVPLPVSAYSGLALLGGLGLLSGMKRMRRGTV